jgi:hypothetical protein
MCNTFATKIYVILEMHQLLGAHCRRTFGHIQKKMSVKIYNFHTPIVKVHIPIVKVHTPIVKVHTPIVKVHTPIVKVQIPIAL